VFWMLRWILFAILLPAAAIVGLLFPVPPTTTFLRLLDREEIAALEAQEKADREACLARQAATKPLPKPEQDAVPSPVSEPLSMENNAPTTLEETMGCVEDGIISLDRAHFRGPEAIKFSLVITGMGMVWAALWVWLFRLERRRAPGRWRHGRSGALALVFLGGSAWGVWTALTYHSW